MTIITITTYDAAHYPIFGTVDRGDGTLPVDIEVLHYFGYAHETTDFVTLYAQEGSYRVERAHDGCKLAQFFFRGDEFERARACYAFLRSTVRYCHARCGCRLFEGPRPARSRSGSTRIRPRKKSKKSRTR